MLHLIKIYTALNKIKWADSWEEGPKHCVVYVPSNAHAQLSSGAKSPALCLKLLLAPYIMRANSEGSGETVRMRRLAWAFAVRICDKYLFTWAGSNAKCPLNRKLIFKRNIFPILVKVWTQWVACRVCDVNFVCDPLRSYCDDCQKNEIHLLYLHYPSLKVNLKWNNSK